MNPSFSTLPATCELCGNWLPDHAANCPRNGVHPSQWAMLMDDEDLLETSSVSWMLIRRLDQDEREHNR